VQLRKLCVYEGAVVADSTVVKNGAHYERTKREIMISLDRATISEPFSGERIRHQSATRRRRQRNEFTARCPYKAKMLIIARHCRKCGAGEAAPPGAADQTRLTHSNSNRKHSGRGDVDDRALSRLRIRRCSFLPGSTHSPLLTSAELYITKATPA